REHLDPGLPSVRNMKQRMMVLKALMKCPLWQQLQLSIVVLTAAATKQLQNVALLSASIGAITDLATAAEALRKRRAAVAGSSTMIPPLHLCKICQESSSTLQFWQCS